MSSFVLHRALGVHGLRLSCSSAKHGFVASYVTYMRDITSSTEGHEHEETVLPYDGAAGGCAASTVRRQSECFAV
jgi:hypothetical protein